MKLTLHIELAGGDLNDLSVELRSFMRATARDQGFFNKVKETGEARREFIKSKVNGSGNKFKKGIPKGWVVFEEGARLICIAKVEDKRGTA